MNLARVALAAAAIGASAVEQRGFFADVIQYAKEEMS
jgi:hypothetical protein